MKSARMTQPQARAIYYALVENNMRLTGRINFRTLKTLARNGWVEMRDVYLPRGLVGGDWFVTKTGYVAAMAFYRDSFKSTEMGNAWIRLTQNKQGQALEAAGRA